MSTSIHVYSAPVDKFYVNSFLVETESSVVLIDTQFLNSTASELLSRVRAFGKPLAAIIVTHPHPDHFNGLPIITAAYPGVPVYATKPTIGTIMATRADKRAAWTPVYGEDYPTMDALPDHELGTEEALTLGGTEFRVSDLGPGESADITVVHIPEADAVIVSDLIYNQCHPWLAEHRSIEWLAQLDQVEKSSTDVQNIFPGHGPRGGVELFHLQRQYILQFRDLVAARARDGKLTNEDLAAIRARVTEGRTAWPLDALIEMNAKALAEEF